MRCAGLALAATALLACTPVAVAAGEKHSWWEKFEAWRTNFTKEYKPREKLARFQTFVTNYIFILEENAKRHTYKLDLSPFTDLSPDEFASTRLGLKRPVMPLSGLPLLGTHHRGVGSSELPESVDWVAEGALGPVKDQGACGSCWAFSAVGALEGAWKIATGTLTPLSEQQFVDCSLGNNGCNGGLMDSAFAFAQGHALCSEQGYPYRAAGGSCSLASGDCADGIPAGAVLGYRDVARSDQYALMEALLQGPVSVAIEADRWIMQHYSSGIISHDCGQSVDHGVLAVGYGTEDELKYWVVRNSWGPRWGMKGYAKLLRGKGGVGECGVLTMASYPVVRAPQPVLHLGRERDGQENITGVMATTTITTTDAASPSSGVEASPTTPAANETSDRPPCNCVAATHPQHGALTAECKDHLERGEAPWCYVMPQATCSSELFASGALPELRWKWCEQHQHQQAVVVNTAAGHPSLGLPVLLSMGWAWSHLSRR